MSNVPRISLSTRCTSLAERMTSCALLGLPLTALYSTIVRIRNWAYDKSFLTIYRSSLRVISVGNVTVGGTGKTPLCIYIASELSKAGHTPVILSRGYGGSEVGPKQVCATDTPKTVGDEPVLIFKRLNSLKIPNYVAKSRVLGVKLIEREYPNSIVILDDGLQHRALHRDVEIVSLYVGSEAGISDLTGDLLPYGRLREPVSSALARTTHIILSERAIRAAPLEGVAASIPVADNRITPLLPAGRPVFFASLQFARVIRLDNGEEEGCSEAVLFAAIANPDGYFNSVRTAGIKATAQYAFTDHHQFSEGDIDNMLKKHPDHKLLCTEKDAVKINNLPALLRSRILVFEVMVSIDPHNQLVPSIVSNLLMSSVNRLQVRDHLMSN